MIDVKTGIMWNWLQAHLNLTVTVQYAAYVNRGNYNAFWNNGIWGLFRTVEFRWKKRVLFPLMYFEGNIYILVLCHKETIIIIVFNGI